jgi:hypothetical protein
MPSIPKASLFFLSVYFAGSKTFDTNRAEDSLWPRNVGRDVSVVWQPWHWCFRTHHYSKRFAQAQPLVAKGMGLVLILLGLRVAFAHTGCRRGSLPLRFFARAQQRFELGGHIEFRIAASKQRDAGMAKSQSNELTT